MEPQSLLSAVAVALLALGPIPLSAAPSSSGARPSGPGVTGAVGPLPLDGHAEALYAEYAVATEHQIAFDIEVLGEGTLAEIDGKAFGQLLGVPEHRVLGSLFGTHIREPRFAHPSTLPGSAQLGDLAFTVQDYADLEYPIAMGAYRTLRVTVAIGDESRAHEALELCWRQLSRCVVIDPVVVHGKSMVDNRLRLIAERWGPKLEIRRSEIPADAPGVCRLAHRPWASVLYRWEAWSATYKNALGEVLLRQDGGVQEAGIRCVGTSAQTCRPAPIGSSLPASCRVEDETYGCVCTNTFSFLAEGTEARARAEARCYPSAPRRAVAEVGDGVRRQLMVAGDGTGGEVADRCVWIPAEAVEAAAAQPRSAS